MTIQDILNGAFKELGVLATGETLPADMAQDARSKLNLMLGSWSIRNVSILVTIDESFSVVGGTGSYTIGPSGVFNTARPLSILVATLEDENQIFTPLALIGEDQFLSYGDRAIVSGLPSHLYYERSQPLGRIFLYYIPDKAYTLTLSTQKPFSSVTTLSEELVVDPVYLEAVIYNLAVRLAPGYGVTPSPLVLGQAQELFDRLLVYSSPDMTIFPDVGIRRPKSETSTIFTIQ
jgi:hypothetical protein